MDGVISFGDGINDITLMKFSGNFVTINSAVEIKKD